MYVFNLTVGVLFPGDDYSSLFQWSLVDYNSLYRVMNSWTSLSILTCLMLLLFLIRTCRKWQPIKIQSFGVKSQEISENKATTPKAHRLLQKKGH